MVIDRKSIGNRLAYTLLLGDIMQFSVIDKITAWGPGDWVRAEKHLRADEPFLRDHFPGTPVMPGVLTLEAMAQAGDWLVQSGRGVSPGRFCLQVVRTVKFMHFARPGDILTVLAKLVTEHADGAELACQAMVGDRMVASARMTLGARDGFAPATLDFGIATSEASEAGSQCADVAATDAFRWLWLDRFIEFREGHSAKAVKRVPCMRQGYSLGCLFPEQLTAALVLEGLAQTGGLLAFDAIRFRKSPIMAKITKAEFDGETEPGTVLEYAAELERLDDDSAAVRVTSRCGQRLHAQAQILYAFVANEGGGAAVDPAIFYTMMCDTGAFDVPREEQPLQEPIPQFDRSLHQLAETR
jgi:3-hydroxyacyl-[acyl-carrier-protein] dehydratase